MMSSARKGMGGRARNRREMSEFEVKFLRAIRNSGPIARAVSEEIARRRADEADPPHEPSPVEPDAATPEHAP